MLRMTSRVLTAFVLVGLTAGIAEAGPPLICHPFDAGKATLLPWGPGTDWKSPLASYDIQKLTADTLALLTPSTPVLARMEIMRRATIYAGQDKKVTAALLKALVDRTKALPQESRDAMPWFDAGYLIESYRQYEHVAGWNMQGDHAEGYQLVKKAIQLAGPNAEMEFAASLMTQGASAAEHRRRAIAGAPEGSLLARNIAKVQ